MNVLFLKKLYIFIYLICSRTDRTGAVWCYVDPYYNRCSDLQRSERFNKYWSYEACATPALNSYQCSGGGNQFWNGGSGGYTGGNGGFTGGSGGFTGGSGGFSGGSGGFSGGSSGFTGGSGGFTGGSSGYGSSFGSGLTLEQILQARKQAENKS